MNIAYVGYKVQEKYDQGVSNDEDGELLSFLKQKGLQISSVVWNDPNIQWKNFDVILIKSPWDYHEHITLFYAWLDKIKALNIKTLNPLEIIKWNSNKRYLDDIFKSGLPVIPSVFLDKGTKMPSNNTLFEALKSNKIVVKPCVSAGAKNTLIINKENIAQQALLINALLETEEFMAQAFVEEIVNGEWSFIFFNGNYSHCVLKLPKSGDFRVQHYLGGSITYPNPDPKFIAQAEQFVKAFAKGTLYARIDGVIKNDTLFLMELELIEPYLFLNSEAEKQENYYTALKSLIL